MRRFAACLQSTARSFSTSNLGVGYELPRYDVTWLKRDALLFAASIGCKYPEEHHYLYELHPKFALFPTYPIVLPFKKDSNEVVDYLASQQTISIPGIPAFDSRRAVDGQRHMELFRPLPTTSEGRKFEILSKVLGIYDKGKPGSVVETEQLLVDKVTNTVYSRTVSSKFYVGQGGWGGTRGPAAPNYKPPEGRESRPDGVVECPIRDEIAYLYRLNGDYNPLHATPEPGQAMGFGGTVVHGLYTWNLSAKIILRQFGGSIPTNIREFQARFAAPVKPGSKIVVKMWRMGQDVDGFEEVRFVTEVNGVPVLSNGRSLIRCV